MARQRGPIRFTAPFRCVIFGKPRSVQTVHGDRLERSRNNYSRWRDVISAQISAAVAKQTHGRGFEVLNQPVKVRLVWYSPDVASESDPDLDNMAKPYIDALEPSLGGVIVNDRLVKDLRILKVAVSDPILKLDEIDDALTSSEFERKGEFVLLMVDLLKLDNQMTIAAEFGR
jgi:Holliday junction resolvase RusA-like endonuclease